MSPHTWIRCLSIGSRCRLLAACAVTLSTLLSLAAPRVHAQDWEGSVEVSTGSLEVPVGGAVSYRVRLSEPPTQDGWWIILRVDGGMRADGEYSRHHVGSHRSAGSSTGTTGISGARSRFTGRWTRTGQ